MGNDRNYVVNTQKRHFDRLGEPMPDLKLRRSRIQKSRDGSLHKRIADRAAALYLEMDAIATELGCDRTAFTWA